MRLKAILLITALGAAALPASAQGYRDCARERGSNQAAGAILGGILGGVVGSNVAASGHRHDGTALGAVLGGVVGSEIGRGNTQCRTTYYGPNAGYAGNSYPAPYPSYPSAYGSAPVYGAPPADYGYYPESEYGSDYSYNRDRAPRAKHGRDLYVGDRRSYKHDDDYAGRDCEEATQITRLPDGSEIRRPVEACRDAYYGDWRVRD